MPVDPTESQSDASRENGKKSHGATSEAGREACKMNAVKHNLTGRKLLIASEDSDSYDQIVSMVFKHYKPVTDMEKLTIQEVADTKWKLQQIPVYESGLCARSRVDNQNNFGPDTVHPEERHIIVEAEILHTYSKSLTNLTLQQGRTQRHLERKIAEFEKLRAERELIKLAAANIAMKSIMGDPKDTRPAHHTVGSVFGIYYLGARIEFIRGAGEKNVLAFDRNWGDPKAKQAA